MIVCNTLSRYEDLMTLPEKALQDLSSFFTDDVIQRILKELNRVLCYVPRINNHHNTTTTTRDTNPYGDGAAMTHYKHYGKEDYKHRHNYQCFSVNKWRYKATRAFVRFVEDTCAPLMERFGYKMVGSDIKLMKDATIPLVQPISISSTA